MASTRLHVLLASGVVNVRVGPRGAVAFLDDVIGMFAATVAQSCCDPRLWRCASVMRRVVFDFSHVRSPLVGPLALS